MAVWPILGFKPGANISNPFGAAQIRSAGFTGALPASNNGMDIAVPAGTPIVAPEGGTVVSVGTGTNSGWGNSVLLRDAQGALHRLSHMRDVPLVQAGQTIAAGQRLGFVGMTGNATGPHLDYEYKPASGGFANPLRQEFTMANSEGAPPNTLTGGNASGSPPPPPPGGPPGGDGDKDPGRMLRDAIAEIDAQLAAMSPAQKAAFGPELTATKQALLRDLATYTKAGNTPAARDEAAQALDRAQAAAAAAGVDLRRAEDASANARAAAQNASAAAIAAGNNATDLTQTAMTTGASREVAQLGAATQRYGYDLQAAQQAANLEWDKEQGRILQAFNEKKLGWEQAVAAANEVRERLTLQLTQQRNAIEAAGLDVTQRGQDLSAGVTQRGQDLEAQTTVRGQDIGRLNQATQSGASLLGNAMSTAGQIGASTGSTALGALRYYAPANAGEAFNRAGQGQAPNLGTVGMPFDPATIVQQAANAAYAKFAPPGQALLAAGQAPSPAFVAPGQLAAPPRVASGYAPVQLPPPALRPGGGGGFVAP